MMDKTWEEVIAELNELVECEQPACELIAMRYMNMPYNFPPERFGRERLCECGSGKEFKKCCERKMNRGRR